MARKRILIVDYEPKLISRLQSLIPAERYDVATAQDGFAALEKFEEFQPDMVLLRTMLPKKHGFQVCQEMVERSGSHPIPIVMHCSIYKSRKYRSDAMKVYGAAEYLEDPIEGEQLNEIIDRFLEKGETPAGPVVPAAREAAAPKPRTSKGKNASMELDKVLEDTLSGLGMGTRKPKVPSVEATVPVGDLPPVEPPAEAHPDTEGAGGEPGVTSEDLFGEVINDVIDEPEEAPLPETSEPEAGQEAAGGPDAEAAEQPSDQQVNEEERPAAKKRPTIDVESALGTDFLSAKPVSEDSSVRRIRVKSEDQLNKKLEETLSGVKLSAKEKAKRVEQAPAEAEERAEAVPADEAPAPEAPPEPEEVPAPAAEAGAKSEEKAADKQEAEPAAAEGEPVPPPPAKEGTPFGNYLLMERIAIGGMAELFKARQNGLEGFRRILAIKRILPHLAANQDFVTMFIDEAKLAAQLSHPNIGHIYDLGKLEDSYFIAMEYVDGKDLRAILKAIDQKEARMPFRVAAYVTQKLCSALSYAHSAKDMDGKRMDLVHRDVSPQNIIISTTGEVKLVDFGIAKAASKASHTQTGALKGKLLYMSPEQAWGKTIDLRADIFALGVVMWEMLTGRKLFYGDSEMSILEKVREAVVESPRSIREDIPEELERIVLKALEKDPSKRYRDCQAMQADIERFCYAEWETLPSAYDAAAFLNAFFPDVYKKDILSNLKREPDVDPVRPPAHKVENREKEDKGKASAKGQKKGASGKKAREQAQSKQAEKRPAEPKKKEEAKAAPPPKPPEPPADGPKGTDDSDGGMFGGVVSGQDGGGSRKGLYVGGGVAAAVIVIAVIAFSLMGGKKVKSSNPPPAPPPQAKAAPAPANTDDQNAPPAQPPSPAPEKAKANPGTKPAEPPAAKAGPSPAEIATARRSARSELASFDKAIGGLEQNGGGKYAADTLASLKESRSSLGTLMRRAKTPDDYKSVSDGARKGLSLVQQAEAQVTKAKADEAAAAKKKADEEAAAKKAAEAAAKKARQEEALKKAKAASTPKIKAGDFVPLWAVDVRPREVKKVPVQYTALARRSRIQGTVFVEVTIDQTGKVTTAKVVKGLSPDYGLNEACLKAALKSKYTPAIKDGVPVKTTLTYPVVFKIQ